MTVLVWVYGLSACADAQVHEDEQQGICTKTLAGASGEYTRSRSQRSYGTRTARLEPPAIGAQNASSPAEQAS